MILKEDIKPISYVKAHTADMMKQVNNTQRPLFVTQNGEAKAVLIDTESYEKLIKAVGLFKLVSQGDSSVYWSSKKDKSGLSGNNAKCNRKNLPELMETASRMAAHEDTILEGNIYY